MPRGFDQPASSSASLATTNTGPREQSQQPSSIRTRQGRFEAPATIPGAEEAKQPHLTTSGRKSSNPSAFQPSPAGRKSPAYLQGRNPYGQVLDRVEHPYREPKPVTTAAPPPQGDSDIDAQSRMPGASDSKTPSLAQEPERCDPQTASPSSRQPQVPSSVRSAKNFFEARASHYSSTPLRPPLTGASTRSEATKHQPPSVPHEPPARVPSPNVSYTPEEKPLELGLLLPSLTEFHDTSESVQSVIPFKQGVADKCAPTITTRKATTPTDTPRDARPFGIDLQTAGGSSAQESKLEGPLAAIGEPRSVGETSISDEVVRCLSTQSSVPAAETREAKSSDLQSQQEGRRAKSGRNIRRTFEDDQGTSPKRLRRSGSHTASLTESGSSSKEPVDRIVEWTPSTNARVSRNKFGKSVNVRRRAEEIVSGGFGHDGASDLSLSRRSTISGPIPTANIGVEDRYHEIEVPDDVDNRQGYGRRVTQDFGFPGARIKFHGPNRSSKLLRDPGNWTKRACGHFSYMGKSEQRDHAQKKICRQCSTRVPPPEGLLPTIRRRTRRRVVSESSTSTVSSSKPSSDDVCRRQRRCSHHPKCISYDKCRNTFADELGHIIDNILEEHTNTLQSVISNIKNSHPGLDQLRRVSGDLVQRHQANNTCSPEQPSCRLDDDWLPPRLYIPPKAAEKLNVGSTGQLKPNLNDPRSSLREALQSIPDLVDLVYSAADDFGVDLEQRPTATDDDMFRDAPYELAPRDPVSYHPDVSLETM